MPRLKKRRRRTMTWRRCRADFKLLEVKFKREFAVFHGGADILNREKILQEDFYCVKFVEM